jgi:hypothetical protein
MTAKLRKKAEALRLDRAATGLGTHARLSRGHQVYRSPPVRLCGRDRQETIFLTAPQHAGKSEGDNATGFALFVCCQNRTALD